MIKKFFMWSPVLNNYFGINYDDERFEAGLLYMLFLSFNKYRDWIIIEERNDNVYIWDNFDEDDYDTWDEIPKLILSKKNYEYILKNLKKIVQQRSKYFVLSYGDNGWIDLEAKDELSEQDWKNVDQEKYAKLQGK